MIGCVSLYLIGGDSLAKAYLICDVKKFLKDSHLIPIQLEAIEYEGNPEIKVSLRDQTFYKTFDRYDCHHDYKHKKHGRVFNRTFTYYFEPTDFYMYYKKDRNISLIQTKTDIGLDFIKTLTASDYYDIKAVNVNFVTMYPLITEITGGWIADLNQTYLKTAGYFGPNVNKSEEFKQAAEIGEVSSLLMKYVSPNSGEELTIGISKKGSVVLYDTFERIEDEIDVVLDIYEKLINPAN